MRNRLPLQWFCLVGLTFLILLGCTTTYRPRPIEDTNYFKRTQTKSEGNHRVTAAVLSAEETETVFGFALYKKGIQPIWLEIENKDDKPTWFLPYSVDPDYFSPLEVTYPYHRTFDKMYNDQVDRFFLDHAMGLYIAPGTTRSGFVFTNLSLGTKSFNVDLVGEDNQPRIFTFFISVPGMRADHEDVDFDNLYTAGEIVSYSETKLKSAVEALPCCRLQEDGKQQVAPINVLLVGHGEDLLRLLIRSGWNETATENQSASKQTTFSNIPQGYRYKSVRPVYYYGRRQDASFRETRVSSSGGNVLRLWLSPMRFEGKPIWIGLVNQDLGQESLSFENQKLDLDEVRSAFLQNLWYAQGIEKFGYVKGTASSEILQPKKIFGSISYITDGYRAVLWVSEESIPLDEVEVLDWDRPPER